MKAEYQSSSEDSDGFSKMFPSSTGRDGRLRPNSRKRGAGQGKTSSKLIGYCKNCGFPINRNSVDHSGGSYLGDGGYGALTKDTATGTLLNGNTFTDEWGDRDVNKGSGCPMCGSKNSVA